HEIGRINEELSFQAALADQTRRWHEVPNGTFESLSLHGFLQMIIPPLQARHPTVQCEILVDPEIRVRASRGSLREILHCLVENAFHAVAFGHLSNPRVRIGASVEGETVRLDVFDNGPGVSAADRERIFEPYITTKKGGDQPLGTGLGLAIA